MKNYFSCFISAFFVFSTTLAQTNKDTIYLDESWSICEKPVAEYYRLASLKADKELFYVELGITFLAIVINDLGHASQSHGSF